MKSREEIVEEMQQVVEQMRLDDLEERPELALAAVKQNLTQVQFNTVNTDFATTAYFLLKQALH